MHRRVGHSSVGFSLPPVSLSNNNNNNFSGLLVKSHSMNPPPKLSPPPWKTYRQFHPLLGGAATSRDAALGTVTRNLNIWAQCSAALEFETTMRWSRGLGGLVRKTALGSEPRGGHRVAHVAHVARALQWTRPGLRGQ